MNITLTGKDAAGNEALPHSLEKVKYDTTRPTLSMLNPLSDVFINYKTISYELDENIKEALLMVTQTGGVFDSRSPQNIQLLSKELKEGKKEHIQLINEPLLENGSIYSFQFSGKDFAGNELHPVSITNISYDNEPPTLSISQPIDYEQIKAGDVLLVNTGDKIPVDGKIIWGEATVDESMITGESIPIDKMLQEELIGGTILIKGSIRMKATGVGEETILSKIIELVKRAQQNKPDIQKLGDKVSAIFVPSVLLISAATFLVSYFGFHIPLEKAIMSAIAVLVISCPCAMGLATPTAVIAGIGRAAKKGILIKGGGTLEEFAKIQTIVFDKTGTLTTGKFKIEAITPMDGYREEEIKNLLLTLEQHSSHPIARSIFEELKNSAKTIPLTEATEEKGIGIIGKLESGDEVRLGSANILRGQKPEGSHSLYMTMNDQLIATIDIRDEIKENAKQMVQSMKNMGVKTILLSGDTAANCKAVADELGIEEIYSGQLPDQKLQKITELSAQGFTAMVGDGINDAPALSQASVGISLGNATQVAIESAQVVLLKSRDLTVINHALQISKHTYLTIKQNLFWAFAYNVVAIPIAAMGMLNPMVGALAMAFSDVIVIGNSIRLKTKKIRQ